MNRFRLSLFLGLTLALSGVALSAQAGCSTAARNTILQQAQQEQAQDQAPAIQSRIRQSNLPGSIGSGSVAQCATEKFPVQLPGVLSILDGIARQTIQSACNQARSAVGAQVPGYLKGLYNVVGNNGANTTAQQAVNSVATPSNIGGLFGGGQ